MGIDRIGKGGGAVPTTGPGGPGGASPLDPPDGVSAPFETHLEEARRGAPVAPITPPSPISPLEELRAGRINLEEYLDLKVERALAPVSGLSPEQREELRSLLRAEVASDPELAGWVRDATGKSPTPTEE